MTDNKYKNGKIYTIRNKNNDTLIYVGSTIQPLHKRFHAHKNNAYNEKCKCYNILLYQKMRETNIEDWYIELYEDLPTVRKEQLNKREGEIIREIGSLNKQIAGRTKKEYQKVYNEANKEQKKEYREANKEAIKERKKEYYEVNKERIKEQRRQRYKNKKTTI